MRGHCIIVSADPQGKFTEGLVAAGETHYPGQIVQVDPTVALVGGRHTFKVYDRAADGDQPIGAFWVVTELNMSLQGKALTSSTSFDSYAAGERASYYSPMAGEELNLLYLNIAGTADDHAAGEIGMVDDGTGKIIATTGSPETEVCVLKETVTDPAADFLAWVEWSGH